MKTYDCCNYCLSLDIKDCCPCYNKDYLEDIKNDFVCDFHVPNYTKIVDEVRADERAKTIEDCKEVVRQHWINGTVAYRIAEEIYGSLERLKQKE